MGYIGMCRFEGYGFQAVQSGIGYINQRVWVQNRVSFFRKLINWLKIIFSLDQGNRELPLKNINKIKSVLFWLDRASVLSTFQKQLLQDSKVREKVSHPLVLQTSTIHVLNLVVRNPRVLVRKVQFKTRNSKTIWHLMLLITYHPCKLFLT